MNNNNNNNNNNNTQNGGTNGTAGHIVEKLRTDLEAIRVAIDAGRFQLSSSSGGNITVWTVPPTGTVSNTVGMLFLPPINRPTPALHCPAPLQTPHLPLPPLAPFLPLPAPPRPPMPAVLPPPPSKSPLVSMRVSVTTTSHQQKAAIEKGNKCQGCGRRWRKQPAAKRARLAAEEPLSSVVKEETMEE
ncbi:hypothetical protein niasHS_016232 [Heterodera schachtii]|uniref:Uncharacterized protein n=1 Tax=Heterodera schachtii TaxID=97005 RepID=A0ABD2HN19_HETSC